MLPCALATLTSAFLLFQVQPLVARAILPSFGGTPAVWTTCMLFFQTLLVAGYGYAHVLSQRPARTQARIHAAVLVLSVVVLAAYALTFGAPLLPARSAVEGAGTASPIWTILRTLAIAVGVPYVVLSTTGPLVQAWLSRISPTASPYRLYALSNAGSLVGLLGYPLVVEPALALGNQALAWSGLYLAFVAVTLITAAKVMKSDASIGVASVRDDEAKAARPAATAYVKWAFFAFMSSTLLLATTNQLCQDIAAIPLLWVVPLSLYLVSFILAFDRPRWYARAVWMPLYAVSVIAATRIVPKFRAPLEWQVAAWALLLLSGCMVSHGELARAKPATRHLTGFYLAIAIGGALGGLFVGVLAPTVFRDYFEVHVAIAGLSLVIVWALAGDRSSPLHTGGPVNTVIAIAALLGTSTWVVRQRFIPESLARATYVVSAVLAGLIFLATFRRPRGHRFAADDRLWARAAVPVVLAGLGLLLHQTRQVTLEHPRQISRSFFGVLRVFDQFDDDPPNRRRVLTHGRIIHGLQLLSNDLRRTPTSYYEVDSGLGRAIRLHPRRATGLRIGVCGLGTGTIAAYAEPHDRLRYYEIDPDVIALSRGPQAQFTFLRDAPAPIDIVLGDARISLADELKRGERQRFDVFAVDAFSGDAIPVHLLTKEAVALYLDHLADDGVLALHVSNRHMKLVPVVKAIARALGLAWLVIDTGYEKTPRMYEWESTWVLIARAPSTLRPFGPPENDDDNEIVPPWTDEYSNIVRALNW
jgi:hypothetical protein